MNWLLLVAGVPSKPLIKASFTKCQPEFSLLPVAFLLDWDQMLQHISPTQPAYTAGYSHSRLHVLESTKEIRWEWSRYWTPRWKRDLRQRLNSCSVLRFKGGKMEIQCYDWCRCLLKRTDFSFQITINWGFYKRFLHKRVICGVFFPTQCNMHERLLGLWRNAGLCYLCRLPNLLYGHAKVCMHTPSQKFGYTFLFNGFSLFSCLFTL